MPDAIDIFIDEQRKKENLQKVRDGTNLFEEIEHDELNLDRAKLQTSLNQGFQDSKKCMKCDFYHYLNKSFLDTMSDMIEDGIREDEVTLLIKYVNNVKKNLGDKFGV